jgi:hypothetical protein
VVVHICNPSIQEVEAGGLRVQSQPGLHNECQDSLSYIARPCLKERGAGEEEGRKRRGREERKEGKKEGRQRGKKRKERRKEGFTSLLAYQLWEEKVESRREKANLLSPIRQPHFRFQAWTSWRKEKL